MSGSAEIPEDITADRPAWLDHYDGLVGRWETEAAFDAGFFGPDSLPITGRGRTTFEWLAGRHFLIQRFVIDHPAAPSGMTVIGPGEDRNTCVQRYFDSRGVARLYQTTFDGRTWKLWRAAPGFWQRYAGVVSDDGATITGAWQTSPDGLDWRHDFALTYHRAGRY